MGERALVSWPLLVSVAALFGSALFVLLAAPVTGGQRARVTRALLPLWRGLATAAMLLSPAALLVATACMADRPLRAAIPLVPEIIRHTHAGRVWAWRLPVTAVLLVAAWAPGASWPRSAWLCALAAVLLLLRSLSSHAIDAGAFAVGVYFAHGAAASLWFGSLAGLWIAFSRPGNGAALALVAPRISKIAGWCVGTLVLTGFYTAYAALGLDVDHLVFSAYGRTLLLKVAFFGLVVSIGGYNRCRLVPAAVAASARRALLRNTAVETVFLAGILGLAALLANTPPPH